MKKIQIIILAAAGVVSFGAAFGITWFVKRPQPDIPQAGAEQVRTDADTIGRTAEPGIPQTGIPGPDGGLARGMTEKQLQGLIYDIREKMKEYKHKEKMLNQQEERLKMAQISLQEDIDQLNELRVQLSTTLASLKQQEDELMKSMLEISEVERSNIQRVAGRYDKMDSGQASKIMISMVDNDQLNDAVKILYYMSDRTSGKLLGEIGNTNPDLASVLSSQLKRIRETQ